MVVANVNLNGTIDLETVSQRIMALAEQAAREHLAAIGRSQAEGLMNLVGNLDQDERGPFGKWR